jgi:muramoyltetrapeptide carboxypeptidase
MSIAPAYLKSGDKIAIVATARKVSREEIQPAIKLFTNWGLQVIIHDDLFAIDNQFAGDDAHRAKALQRYLDDPSIRAIICARGGYGTVRIIDQLDFTNFVAHPKWIIGYSDITVLHSHIYRYHGIQTLHAAMPINMQEFNADEESMLSLKQALFGNVLSYSFPSHPLNSKGEATGELVGGNLSVLYSLLGSPSDIDTTDKILFLEDLDEYMYHIDRMMMNMKRNGKLDRLKGLIIGGMNDMKDNTIPFGKTAEEIIHDQVKEFNYPVWFGFPAGHEKRNMAMKLGATASMLVQKETAELYL